MESSAAGSEMSRIDWGEASDGWAALPLGDDDLFVTRDDGGGIPPALADLQARRDSGERWPAADRPLSLSGVRLHQVDLSRLDLTGADLSYAELVGCNLRGTRLERADLTGALLNDANLVDCELVGADLAGTDLSNSHLMGVGLVRAKAHEAIFYGTHCAGASFNGTDLSGADFRAADLTNTRFPAADLSDADLATAVLVGADLTGARVEGATLREADLTGGRLRDVRGYASADWINTDITDVDFTGAWNVRRHIQDTNYIHEFRTQSASHELLYWVWWVTSDCGRSLLRWSMWTALVAVLYALAYSFVDVDWGPNPTVLSPLYFSVVTFTTLGFGDAVPGSSLAQALTMSQVVLGYFSLGGMMSILSDKMARRAG